MFVMVPASKAQTWKDMDPNPRSPRESTTTPVRSDALQLLHTMMLLSGWALLASLKVMSVAASRVLPGPRSTALPGTSVA